MKDSKIEWAGKIPEHWREIPNKFLFYNSSEKVGDEAEHYQLLSLTTQGVKKKDKNATGGKVPLSYDNYQTVDVGDIIFCLFDLDCSAVFAGVSPYCGMITSAYDVLTPRDAVLYNKYADYWFQYAFSNRYYKLYSKNIRFAVTNDVFGSILTIVPPLAEQKKIADFLDGKCAEIDELVQTEEKMIEELKAYKQSVITEAVTKGLDPTALMKDSGIEWIGEIPITWDVRRAKQLFATLSGNGLSTDLQVDDGIPFYKAGDISTCDKFLEVAKSCVESNIAEERNFNIIPATSIVFAKIGEAMKKNSRAITTIECCIDNNCQALIPKRVDCIFAYYLMLCIDMRWFDNAGTLPCVSVYKLMQSSMPYPHPDEQKQIADYLDEKCAKIDEIIALRTEQINQLKEYKKSLIYEYVTGKKEAV